MSRTYRNIARYIDKRKCKMLLKKLWNTRIRKDNNIVNGKMYKKANHDRCFEDDMSWYQNEAKYKQQLKQR